jgi:glycosyltransferase involved in cell wall biosynthesis
VAPAPAVSVVVPLYNGAPHILQTLDAVFAQTHRPLEVIVVDDGSTDNSREVVAASGHPVRLLQQENGGVCRARNHGARSSQGEFLCFLDQDDIWYPEHLQRQVAVFAQRPDCGVVVSPYQHWYPQETGFAPAAAVKPAMPEGELDAEFTGWVYHQFMLDCWALTSATLMRRQVWDAWGGFDTAQTFGEEWDLWLRLSQVVQFAKLQWPPVLYRQHATQGSRWVRPVDHRVELLLRAQRAHGLCSRDGRCVPTHVFAHTIAKYEMEFGWGHAQFGDRATAVRALLRAWRRAPAKPGYLARALAALVWRQAAVGTLTSNTKTRSSPDS